MGAGLTGRPWIFNFHQQESRANDGKTLSVGRNAREAQEPNKLSVSVDIIYSTHDIILL